MAQTEAEGHWGRVVEIVQIAFREGELAEESTWQAVVLIPKRKGDYQGIVLVEVMWKVMAVILNLRLTSSITFHDVLHGFWAGLCEVTEWRGGTRVPQRWWEQPGIDWRLARENRLPWTLSRAG